MAAAEPGAGNVDIVLDGKPHTMTPSLEACRAVSRLGGGNGATAVINRLHALDFDMICEVIALGTGFTAAKQKEQIAEAVYQAGTISYAADCILFVRIVNNGGRPPENDEDKERDGDDDDGPLPESRLANTTTA